MSSLPPKGPPRFVPTLTDVVQVAAGDAISPLPAPQPVPASMPTPVATSAMPSVWTSPRPLAQPTVFPPAPAPVVEALAVPPMAAKALPHGFEEDLVHRVMQRVDVVLDQRLREAIATVVQEQTRSMVPRLREEVESVVRQSVYEAVADELSPAHNAKT